ncbi:MAG: type II toxin-antitoxin system prevent-host-death family antitoxin [Arcobacteraceae bacterium]|nr:type II toxin-antitoxin system prevent-host-death family antitoxin [Arcobacteraceae bacterium]
MQTQTFSYARQNLASTMDIIINNHTPITITRQSKEPIVMISLEDYKSMQETSYLMQSSNNANRLNGAITQLEAGLGNTKELIEE